MRSLISLLIYTNDRCHVQESLRYAYTV